MARAGNDPLTDEEFARALGALALRADLAIAVSGGCDSLALLDLSSPYAKARGLTLTALTVDHGLRPDSRADAEAVRAAAGAMGVAHVILTWEGEKPRANLEAKARAARYALMCDWCLENNVPNLLVAHTLNDQAETLVMRLARGSGVDGLAAMAPRMRMRGVTVARPLLNVPRTRLEARLKARGIGWFEDPMNQDPQFLRVRIRQAQAALADLGLTPVRLAATAKAMARARAALEETTDALMRDAFAVSPLGFCDLDLDKVTAASDETALRALAHALMGVGGLRYRPRLERLERLYALMRAQALGAGRTLGGCRILPLRTGRVQIMREAALIDRAPLALRAGQTALWDNRFRVSLAPLAPLPGEVRALGEMGARRLEELFERPAPDGPARLRATLPGLWVNGELVAVPSLGLERAGGHRFEVRFEGLRDQNTVAEPEEAGLY